MRDVDDIVRDRQRAMRREIDRRGIALKAVAYDSSIPMTTLLTYFPGGERDPAVLPATALFKLLAGNALPHDILSLLLPDGEQIVRLPEDIDHDEVEAVARDFLATKGAAHHPDSEAGREIGPKEADTLNEKVAHLRAVAA
ncbi:hypothetical protein [Sphingobium fuliginis]|uniref:Uncharacterized protein n=1 Tax=Sphingobium fuliginis ATCC 27551 TaxID=1208342 RepID=A0A5B8CC75_SPHSA|nr:hypothetical protein [Sphingobium fuliginis]QDC37074.1 hypothetical protein FIL70_07415 [Sphingobium fuliginis ATCC 27551]